MKYFLLYCTLFSLSIFSLSAGADTGDNKDVLLQFFSNIEGDWYEPQQEGSADSYQLTYALTDNVVLLTGEAATTDEEGTTWYGIIYAEFKIQDGALFQRDVQLQIIELLPNKITYSVPPSTATTTLSLVDDATLQESFSYESDGEVVEQVSVLKRSQ